MDLKVYDAHGHWVRVANASDIEYAKGYAARYRPLVPPLRVVEMRVIEVQVDPPPVDLETFGPR